MDRRDVLKSAAAAAAGFLLPTGALAETAPAPQVKLNVRPSGARGHANLGWLDTRYTFSFSNYHDRRWMGFRSLRVINEDWIKPGRGFGTHPHDNMEIITYVLEGSLQHKDSLGGGGVIVPGEIQQMSAGTGIRHSEFNPSDEKSVHLLQIWLKPDRRGVTPKYGQKKFPAAELDGTLRLVASKAGAKGSIPIHQDANLYAGKLDPTKPLTWRNPKGRHVWLQVARGKLHAGGRDLVAGDGAWTSEAGDIRLAAKDGRAEILLFDLA